MTRTSLNSTWPLAVTVAVLCLVPACNRQTQQSPSVKTRPAGETPTKATPPEDHATNKPTATQPTPTPATKPAPATRPPDEPPPSTFDSHPPYPVQLNVRKPEDKQPGWLKILTLADEHARAKAHGEFPKQNIIEVTTDNVRVIQVELSYLPLAEHKQVILRIDGQGIEITQRSRRFLALERRPTGEWSVRKAPKE